MDEHADQYSQIISEIDSEIPLYSGNLIKLVVPSRPPISIDSGLSVAVLDKENAVASPLSIVRRAVAAEGVLKVIAESGVTPDAWANLHIDANDGTVWVFGRTPKTVGSWREPVVRSSREAIADLSLRPHYDSQTLQRLFRRYIPGWEQLAKKMQLFDGGIGGRGMFEISKEGWKVWENSTYWIELIRHPHLDGFHFVVRPRPHVFGKEFQRQWQTAPENVQPYIQATAEMIAIGLGVDALVDKEKRGQLHVSGNWAEGLRISPDPGGHLDAEYLASDDPHAGKREKRKHRLSGDFGTKPHLHVYIPIEGTNVVLPRLWKGEIDWRLKTNNLGGYTPEELRAMIDAWEKIPPIEEDDARVLAGAVGEDLTEWLEKNFV